MGSGIVGDDINASMQSLKMIAVFVVPVLAFVAITSARAYASTSNSQFINTAVTSVERFMDVTTVMHQLCTERSLVIGIMASSRENLELSGRLFYLHKLVDESLGTQLPYLQKTKTHSSALDDALRDWHEARECIGLLCNLTVDEVRDIYSSLISTLMDTGMSQTSLPQSSVQNDLWTQFVGSATLLRIVAVLSHKQSYLVEMMTYCEVSRDHTFTYQSLDGHMFSMLNMLNNYSPAYNKKYAEETNRLDPPELDTVRAYLPTCMNQTNHEHFTSVKDLLEKTDRHINTVMEMMQALAAYVTIALDQKKTSWNGQTAGMLLPALKCISQHVK